MSHDHANGNTTKNGDSLGLAGRTARAFIHSPLSPLLFFAMLAMGVLGLLLTPRQEDPQISVPMVDVFVSYPGASSEQVASAAIDPLQRIMSEIPGVKHVYSASAHGEGMVTVEFDVGEQLGPSIVKVHDKIQSHLDKIPPGVSMPLVKPKGIDDVPVVTLTLWSEDVDDGALRTLGLDLLQSLKQIPNTGQGFVVGGRAEQVRVEVMPERLSGYGVSMDMVANTIQTANSEQKAGSAESGDSHYTVYTGSFLHTAEDIARLVVSVNNGVPVYVRDVANVFQAPEEPNQVVNFYTGPAYGSEVQANGVPAVTVAVAKKEGANGVTVANAVIDKVGELKGQIIPDNVHVEVTRNYGDTANAKVNELILKLFVATAAVAFLVWAALGVRPALVVVCVIPVVILITVFSAWILGFTIDRVSLFALIFSIGILVDDAIVVVENIYRRWLLNGETDSATAVDAVREVGNPTILATFTVIAALLPMGFVSGMMGPYMAPIPALGSVAMLFSLLAAFIFAPWLTMRWRPSMAYLQQAERKEHSHNERLERFFRQLLLPMIRNKVIGYSTLGIIILLFFASCAMFYTRAVTVKMLPYDNKPEYSVVVDLPEGTALPVTQNLITRLAEQVRDIPEVTAIQTYAGTAQPFDFNGMVRHYYLRKEPWQGELHIQLLDKGERDRSSHAIAVASRALLTPTAHAAGARITIVEMPPGPPVLQSIVAEIYGPDAATRRAVAQKLTDSFEQAQGVADVDSYMQEPYDVWRFEVDTEKAVRRGISVDTINRNLKMAMGGERVGDIKQGTVLEPTYIVVQVPLATRSQIARLKDLPVIARDGSRVPLTELGQFIRVSQDPMVYHKDLRPVEYVVGDAVGRYAAPIYGMWEVEALLGDYHPPGSDQSLSGSYLGPPDDDITQSAFEWTGEWTVTYETFRDMGAAFGVALILIYILVVWEFGNFVVPLVIMAPIPLTLIGIIPGHWLMGAEFTATSMIGFIALAGIIVRNSILLVDFSMQQVLEGVPVREAVILSCKARTRPILITALALVLGSMVILVDPIFQGMAISLLFGVMVATLLTLVVIPLGCISTRKSFCPVDANGTSLCVVDPEDEAEEQARAASVSLWQKLSGVFQLLVMIGGGLLAEGSNALKARLRRWLGVEGGGNRTPPPPSQPPTGGAPTPAAPTAKEPAAVSPKASPAPAPQQATEEGSAKPATAAVSAPQVAVAEVKPTAPAVAASTEAPPTAVPAKPVTTAALESAPQPVAEPEPVESAPPPKAEPAPDTMPAAAPVAIASPAVVAEEPPALPPAAVAETASVAPEVAADEVSSVAPELGNAAGPVPAAESVLDQADTKEEVRAPTAATRSPAAVSQQEVAKPNASRAAARATKKKKVVASKGSTGRAKTASKSPELGRKAAPEGGRSKPKPKAGRRGIRLKPGLAADSDESGSDQ